MARKDTNVEGMTPLQALIVTRMTERGWTPPQVEKRGVKHATLHRYMNPVQLRTLPRQSVLADLAKALDLTVEEVRDAAVRSLDSEQDESWRRSLRRYSGHPAKPNWEFVVSRADRRPLTDEQFFEALRDMAESIDKGVIEAFESAVDDPKDYARAGRKGIPRKRLGQHDHAE